MCLFCHLELSHGTSAGRGGSATHSRGRAIDGCKIRENSCKQPYAGPEAFSVGLPQLVNICCLHCCSSRMVAGPRREVCVTLKSTQLGCKRPATASRPSPDLGADPKRRSADLALYSNHRSSRVQNWGFYFLDPPAGSSLLFMACCRWMTC